jgi:Tfp pilus assembly major pilin PilA
MIIPQIKGNDYNCYCNKNNNKNNNNLNFDHTNVSTEEDKDESGMKKMVYNIMYH